MRPPLASFDGIAAGQNEEQLDDDFLIDPLPLSQKEKSLQRRVNILLVVLGSVAALALALACAAIALALRESGGSSLKPTPAPPGAHRSFSRIAFGSCTAYDLRPQPIWEQVPRHSSPELSWCCCVCKRHQSTRLLTAASHARNG